MNIKLIILSTFLNLTLLVTAQPKKALIRLEDVGLNYANREACIKLKAIADYLSSQGVPFQIAMIPRYKKPSENIDRSIADLTDPLSVNFVKTIKYCQTKGASIGLHGYTHQYNNSESGPSFEFYAGENVSTNTACYPNCPPDDVLSCLQDKKDFDSSQVSVRLKAAFEAASIADIKVDWFETPHYKASATQRQLIEAWSGILYENYDRNIKLISTSGDNRLSNGTLYVSTPLYYVSGQDAVTNMCAAIQSYTSSDIASFFLHPYLEFNSITLNADGSVNAYDTNSYLHQLIACFKAQQFTFVSIKSLYNFIPSKRQTNLQRKNATLLIGDVTGEDDIAELIFHDSVTGTWEVGKNTLAAPPLRYQPDYNISTYLSNWGAGTIFQPLIGDVNGDKKDDVIVYDSTAGQWQVALSNGNQFIPDAGASGNFLWLDKWGIGNNWKPLTGDFDGDGTDDVLLYNKTIGDWQVALSNGNSFSPDAGGTGSFHWLENWGVGDNWQVFVGNFDGNKTDDILIYNNTSGDWQVALSNGNSFTAKPTNTGNYHWQLNWGKGSQWKPLVGDFNGDKKTDILVVDLSNGDWQISLSTGARFLCAAIPFKDWGKYPDAFPLSGRFTKKAKSSILLWNKTLFNGTIDFAISNIDDGIDQKEETNSIIKNQLITAPTIYPNPTKEKLNVFFNTEGLKEIMVYTIVGQLMQSVETRNNSIELDLSSYQPGVYFIRVKEGDGFSVQKFIVED